MTHSAWTAGKEKKLTKTNTYEEDLKNTGDSMNEKVPGENVTGMSGARECNGDRDCGTRTDKNPNDMASGETVNTDSSRTDGNETKNSSSGSEVEADENDKNKDDVERTEDAETRFLRLMADFQNFKKRAEKEKFDIYARANESLMLSLLTVIDNFERALDHESKDEKYAEGMHLIFKQLMDALKAAGLEEIKAENEHFDPNIHNAVMTCDSHQHESGKVVEVMQKGYTLNGKLLRASMVKVNN